MMVSALLVNTNKKLSCVSLGLVAVTMLSFLALSSSTASADTDVITTTTINVPVSCTMEGTNNTAHTATLLNGMYSGTDYTNGIGTTTLRVFCNDNAGYAIYAIGYTNNEYGNTLLHWNKAANASDTTNDIDTGIYDSTDPTDSTWSVKLASSTGTYITTIADGTDNDEDYTDWHIIPDEYERVAYKTSGTDIKVDNTGTGSSITVTYDAYISTTQPAGAYVGQVKYTLVHPHTEAAPMTPLDPSVCPNNSICYAPNADDVEGDMSSLGYTTALHAASPKAGQQIRSIGSNSSSADISSNTTSVELIAPNFYRPGYGFAGWSTDFEATDSSIIYGPNETISTDLANGGINVSGGLILYPVWVASAGNLQGWTGCSSLATAPNNSRATLSSITALADARDNNVYTVARLADGLCWMVENLRLNSEHTISEVDFAKAQGYGQSTTYGDFIGLANSEDINFGNSTIANSLYSVDGSNGTMDINSTSSYYAIYRLPRYNNNNTNMVTGAKNSQGVVLEDYYYLNGDDSDNHVRWYSYGNYYNWPAAKANTAYLDTRASSDAANTSLCPLGWRLPLGYQSTGTLAEGSNDPANRVGSFAYLDRKMGGNGNSSSTTDGHKSMSYYWRSFPNNFVYSGRWADARARGRGATASYWASTASSVGRAYLLYLYVTVSDPRGDDLKYEAYSVRCVTGL